MNITYDGIADRAYLKDAAQKHADEITRIFGADPVEVSWVLRTETTPRELVLVAKSQERQAEESITSTELFQGNGPFTDKLKRMKDALTHNGAWRVGVCDLMRNVREWCRSLPNTTTEEYTVTLNEERSGRYELPALRVRRNGVTAFLKPAAEWVVPPSGSEEDEKVKGSQIIGRVDLNGAFRPIPLYLLSSGKWIYQSRVLNPKEIPQIFGDLDQSAFLRLLLECMDE
jgi:hypothetical protein